MADTLKDPRRPSGLVNDYLSSNSSIDNKELKQWLLKSNCQHHYGRFIENGITFDLLPELDTSALREIGIAKLGDRLRLELAISSLKSDRLSNSISIDELDQILNIGLKNSSPGEFIDSGVNKLDLIDSNDSSTLLLGSQSSSTKNLTSSTAGSGTSANKDSNKNITFILQDGNIKRVNVTGCFNAQSIKRKVLKRLGIKQQEASYDTYIHSKDNQNGVSSIKLNRLYDVELVTICYSPDRLEKHRIILCPKSEEPSNLAIEMSKKIMQKYEKFDKSKQKGRDSLSQYHIPDPTKVRAPTMRNFFGQRPPSELISSNLAEYFPEARQQELEATVRNSVRYSVRLSRRFNFPTSVTPVSSNTSVNSPNYRLSIMSTSTQNVLGRTSSIFSGEQAGSQRRFTNRTIGDVMMNNISAIDEAVNSSDTQSVLSKPPSISGGGAINTSQNSVNNSTSGDASSIKSAASLLKPGKHRLSIATNFAEQSSSSNNRYSRIELFSIDSDNEEDNDESGGEDFITEYGTYNSSELNNGYTGAESIATKNASIMQKKWLQGARIGAGSFGTVYLGMDPFTGELMAVKQVSLPDKESANNELQKSMLEALEREMTFLKELNHENIVRYLGSSIDDTYLNIFLEYVPGGSVQSMLTSYGPFEEPLIRNFIRQVLIGLIYLHGEDIIHRDIKGANILIDIKGTVKISDFGISKKVGSSNVELEDNETGQGQQRRGGRRASLQGSVYWMAPEVVKQTAYTKKADIWSVGCLIVEMFTGKHPFPNFSQMQAIFKIGTHITPQIPEWCTMEAKDFLEKTFELEYEKRPSAVEMLGEAFLNPLIMSKQ